MAAEETLVRRLREVFPGVGAIVPNGDDCAIFSAPPKLAVSVDTQIEGVHFRRSWASAKQLGARLIGVTVSDLAAVGAQPAFGVLSLILPPGLSHAWVLNYARGAAERAACEGLSIIGGDVATGRAFCAVLTVCGAAPARPMLRSGARLGDWLCVTGPVGGAARELHAHLVTEARKSAKRIGRRWLNPPSCWRLACRLAADTRVHAAIDISDGLFLDAGRMAEASGLGLRIELEAIPVEAALARQRSRLALAEWLRLVGGGEDYELLVAVEKPLPGLFPIGRFVANDRSIVWKGKPMAWPKTGYLHDV